MNRLLSRRVVLVTGKGGVGKTTIAAGLALAAARQGKRVLLAEVAASASEPSAASQALGAGPSTEEPVPLAPGVHGALLTPSMGHRRFLQDTLPIRMAADAAMRSAALRRFLGAAPAFGEMGVLYRMLDLLRRRRPDGSPEHELCVVDSPATGHALALTQLPEVILKIIPGGPIGSAVREGLSVLTDPARTATLVVTLPETLPVSEAVELAEGLGRHKVPVAGLVMNRMPEDPFTEAEREQLAELDARQGPLFGARVARRMEQAGAALRRLRERLDAPVAVVPERPESWPELAAALSGVLAARLGLSGEAEAPRGLEASP